MQEDLKTGYDARIVEFPSASTPTVTTLQNHSIITESKKWANKINYSIDLIWTFSFLTNVLFLV